MENCSIPLNDLSQNYKDIYQQLSRTDCSQIWPMALLSTSHEIWMNIRNKRRLFCDIWKLYYTETYVHKYNFIRTLPGILFECYLGCVCAAKPGIFPLWPLKKKRVATSSSSQRRKTGTETFRNLPRVTQLLREEPRFKPRLSTLNPPMLLLLNDACWAKDTTVRPARRARCHRRPGESERPGHGRSEWLNPQLDPHCLPVLGNRGRRWGWGSFSGCWGWFREVCFYGNFQLEMYSNTKHLFSVGHRFCSSGHFWP